MRLSRDLEEGEEQQVLGKRDAVPVCIKGLEELAALHARQSISESSGRDKGGWCLHAGLQTCKLGALMLLRPVSEDRDGSPARPPLRLSADASGG